MKGRRLKRGKYAPKDEKRKFRRKNTSESSTLSNIDRTSLEERNNGIYGERKREREVRNWFDNQFVVNL